MSYDLGLYYDGAPAVVERHAEGGTYVLGGCCDAQLNITYNYSNHFYEHLDADKGLRWLYGKSGKETIDRLAAAVEGLGTDKYCGPNYVWSFTSFKESRNWPDLDLNAPENDSICQQLIARGHVHDSGAYWCSTPGNAGYALSILLGWARQHPDAVWDGD